ncbi:hypothetical protein BJX96DRAFT_145262 [Aspergillus floccosus]
MDDAIMRYICIWRLLSFIVDYSVCLVALPALLGSSNGMVDCIDFFGIYRLRGEYLSIN